MSANKVQPAKLSKGQRKRARAAALKAAQATGQPAPSSSKRQQLAQKSQHKSHQVVRPQQPYPNAFLGAPVEVLARIIRLLLPVDVMALARTNTTLRKFLMNRSAGHIWRASIQNVEGLPACPTEICEPLYVSLIYTPACSVCGKGENRSMDTYLYIRACLRCRNLLVIDWEKIKPPEVQSLVFASSASNTSREFCEGLKLSLRSEVKVTIARLAELQSSNDKDKLQAWVQAKKEDLLRRLEARIMASQLILTDTSAQFGGTLSNFLVTARQNATDESKRKWREGLEQKLDELGWMHKEEDFPYFTRSKWRSFFNRTTEFTPSSWAYIKPKIAEFLEADAQERVEREQSERRSRRYTHLKSLFDSVRSLKDTLPRKETPEDSDGEGGDTTNPSLSELSVAEVATRIATSLPPPEYADVLEWPLFKNLLETDIPVEEMTKKFEAHRNEIEQMISDWGVNFKKYLVKSVREGRQKAGLVTDPPRPRLRSGELVDDPFQKMSLDDSLLLRADTVFRFSVNGTCTYDGLILHLRSRRKAYSVRDVDEPLELESFSWSPDKSAVAQILLASMGCPDVTSLDLNHIDPLKSQLFFCGRCRATPQSWSSIVAHYTYKHEEWEEMEGQLSNLAELNIPYNYLHDMGPSNPKPLFRLLSFEEQEKLNPDEVRKKVDILDQVRLRCKLCEKGKIEDSIFDEADILFHVVNVHDVSDPLNGSSIGDQETLKDNPYMRHCERFEGLTLGWTMSLSY